MKNPLLQAISQDIKNYVNSLSNDESNVIFKENELLIRSCFATSLEIVESYDDKNAVHPLIVLDQIWTEDPDDKTGWTSSGWNEPSGYELIEIVENDKWDHPTKAIFKKVTSSLNNNLNARLIDQAIHQLTGFMYNDHRNDVKDFLQIMGLSHTEWLFIKERLDISWMNTRMYKDIDDFFKFHQKSIDVDQRFWYEHAQPDKDNQTRLRLKQIKQLGLVEVGEGQFGIPQIMSGLYIEKLWSADDQEWIEYLEFIRSTKSETFNTLQIQYEQYTQQS